jgi:hypothetical protein
LFLTPIAREDLLLLRDFESRNRNHLERWESTVSLNMINHKWEDHVLTALSVEQWLERR